MPKKAVRLIPQAFFCTTAYSLLSFAVWCRHRTVDLIGDHMVFASFLTCEPCPSPHVVHEACLHKRFIGIQTVRYVFEGRYLTGALIALTIIYMH
jgi:hypothetical protein